MTEERENENGKEGQGMEQIIQMEQKIKGLGSYEILESRQVPDLNSYGFLFAPQKNRCQADSAF